MKRRGFLLRGGIASGILTMGKSGLAQEQRKETLLSNGYNYPLPKFDQGTKLLFQGDSITDMQWGRNQKDRNHYLGHSYVFLIASRLGVDMPGAKLDFFNRGVRLVGDLRKRWQKDAIEMNPTG